MQMLSIPQDGLWEQHLRVGNQSQTEAELRPRRQRGSETTAYWPSWEADQNNSDGFFISWFLFQMIHESNPEILFSL